MKRAQDELECSQEDFRVEPAADDRRIGVVGRSSSAEESARRERVGAAVEPMLFEVASSFRSKVAAVALGKPVP